MPRDFIRSYKEVKKIISNYRNNKDLPMITNSGVIDIDKFDDFVEQLNNFRKKNDSIRALKIYLFRENANNDEREVQKISSNPDFINASNLYTQVGFIMVPHNNEGGLGKDVCDSDGNVFCMYTGGENSGLCPPNCGDSDII